MKTDKRRFFNLVFISIYIIVAIYIILFRFIYDIVGSDEPEYYPMEIITTITVIISVVISYLIFYENKKQTSEIDKVYLLLFIFYIAYFLAENNWLSGRESGAGTFCYAIFAGIIFLLMLVRTYNLDRSIFILFLMGTISLAIGSIIDAIIDEVIPLTLNLNNRILYEEIPEVYASLFFLHSILMLYIHITQEKCRFMLDDIGASMIIICSIIIGYGNSYLLLDHGAPLRIDRLIIGIILYLTGLFLVCGYFIYYLKYDENRYWHDVG
jgi:hypothetical protein